MRVGPIAHGALLVAALVFAYQTWTREKTEAPKVGTVTVWQESMDDFVSFAYDGAKKSVRVERREEGGESYYWGQVTRTEKKAKPRVPVKAPDPGDAAGGAHGAPGAHGTPGAHGMPGGAPMPGRPGGPGKSGQPAPGKAGPGKAEPGKAAPATQGTTRPDATRPGASKPGAGAGAGSSTKPPAQGLSPHHAGTDQQPDKAGATPAKPAGGATPAKPAGGAPEDKPAAADKPAGVDKPAAKPADKPAGTAPAKPVGGDKPAGDKPAGQSTAEGQSTPDEGADEDHGEGDEAGDEPVPAVPTPSKPKEFPVGKAGNALIVNLVHLHALRDLGVLTDQQKEEYQLADSKENLTVFFKNEKKHSLIIGARVFGGGDRYVMDADTGKGYVISNTEIMRHIDGAENSLGIKNLHRFQEEGEDVKAAPADPHSPKPKRDKYPGVSQIEMEASNGSRALVRLEQQDPQTGGTIIGWADKQKPAEVDMTFGNFLTQIERLKPVEYDTTVDESKLTKVLTLRYKKASGDAMGTFELYRQEPAVTPELEPSEDSQKQNQPEYLVKTELTRLPGKVSRMSAERVTEDLPQLFGAPPKKDAKDAKGANPATDKGEPAPAGTDNRGKPAPDKTGQDKSGAAPPAAGSTGSTPANPAGSKSSPTEGNK